MVKYKKKAQVPQNIKKVNGCVYSNRSGNVNATRKLAIQLIKMPTAMAVSRAYNGNILLGGGTRKKGEWILGGHIVKTLDLCLTLQ